MSSLGARLAEMATLMPGVAENAKAIVLLDDHVSHLRFEPFVEPLSVTLVSKGKKSDVLSGTPELLHIGPARVTGGPFGYLEGGYTGTMVIKANAVKVENVQDDTRATL